MRGAIAVVLGTLILSFGRGPALAQTHAGETPALESIHMTDELTGWAVTHEVNGLLRTSDGGLHWKDVTPRNSSGQRVEIHAVAVLTSLMAWGVGGPNIYRTADGGQTWKSAGIPAGAEMLSFVNPREGWFLVPLGSYTGHTDVDIYRSTDGGDTWIRVANNTAPNSGLTNMSGITGMTFHTSQRGWITGLSIPVDWLYLYVTDDGGRTWQNRKLPLLPQLSPHWESTILPPTFFTAQDGVLPVFFSMLDNDFQPTDAMIGVFYATRNGGATWTYTTPVSFKQGNGHVSAFADAATGWLTDGDALYATRDGGRVWKHIQPPAPFGDVKQLSFVSRETGLAVSRTYPWLLKTADGGNTWAAVSYAIERP